MSYDNNSIDMLEWSPCSRYEKVQDLGRALNHLLLKYESSHARVMPPEAAFKDRELLLFLAL